MLRTLRKPILSAAGLAVAAASLAVAFPCTLDARKLSEPVFIVRRYTPATGLGLPS